MPQIKISLEHGRPTDASCINQHIVTGIIMAELTLVLVVQTRTNSPISVSMIFTLESNSVVKQALKSHALLETAKVSV
jgi:hypothetical protein